MILASNINVEEQVWAVFTGESDLRSLRWLRSGFRHCFVLMNDGQRWISIDPLSHITEIVIHHLPASFDLPGWLESRGHSVVQTEIIRPQKPAPLMPFTCVESVKRILGIHDRLILTPWQLYKHLNHHVIPAKAGTSKLQKDSGFRRNDSLLKKGTTLWEV